MPPCIEILGVPIARLDSEAALAEIERLYCEDAPASVGYANAHTLTLASQDPEYRALLRRLGLVLNDGFGVAIAARMQGQRFPIRNVTDFNPHILTLAAERGWPAFFLGGRLGVPERAAHQLKWRIPGLQVVGTRDGYFPPAQVQKVINEIRDSGAKVLIIAMGQPLQELWLDRYLPQTGARLGVGVGGFLDFSAGVVPRAPQLMSRLGFEWLYRLRQDPRRLWRRYIVGNPLFLYRVMRERLTPRS